MKKKIIFGCIIAVLIMIMLPSTSVAESNSVEERVRYEEIIQNQSEENVIIRVSPHEPTLILRLLLIIRNLLLLGIVGIIGIIFTLLNLINSSA